MSLLLKAAGITKLSELNIDADKDWAAKSISNLKEIALAMAHGDVNFRGAAVVEKLIAGVAGQYLKTQGINQPPIWDDIPGNRFERLFFLTIPQPSISLVVAEDHSGGGFTATPSLSVPVPTISVPTVEETSVNACGGAVAHDDDGADTDQTAEANEGTADDMTLLQADGSPADWYALGYANLFDAICLYVSTVGADLTLNTFEYSKGGGAWGALTVIMNQLNDYETLGKRWFTFTRPVDWAVDTYAGIADMYWIKLKSSATGGGYVQPKGQQAWILVY